MWLKDEGEKGGNQTQTSGSVEPVTLRSGYPHDFL